MAISQILIILFIWTLIGEIIFLSFVFENDYLPSDVEINNFFFGNSFFVNAFIMFPLVLILTLVTLITFIVVFITPMALILHILEKT